MAIIQDRPEEHRFGLGSALGVVVMLGFLVASACVAWYVWQSVQGVTISGFGMVALAVGIVVTVLVGAGLTTLLIVSSRRGYDERAGHD